MNDHSIGEVQSLQYLLCVCDQRLQLGIRVLWPCEFHQLDLVELVLPENAADVFSVRARLAAEAWSVCRELHRQPLAVDDVIAVNVGDRNFGGWNQVVVRIPQLKKIFFE